MDTTKEETGISDLDDLSKSELIDPRLLGQSLSTSTISINQNPQNPKKTSKNPFGA